MVHGGPTTPPGGYVRKCVAAAVAVTVWLWVGGAWWCVCIAVRCALSNLTLPHPSLHYPLLPNSTERQARELLKRRRYAAALALVDTACAPAPSSPTPQTPHPHPHQQQQHTAPAWALDTRAQAGLMLLMVCGAGVGLWGWGLWGALWWWVLGAATPSVPSGPLYASYMLFYVVYVTVLGKGNLPLQQGASAGVCMHPSLPGPVH